MLFSIEVTCTYYSVSHLWKAMFTAVCGALVFRVGAREVRVPLASIATGAVRSEPLAPGRPELRHLAAGPPF